MAMGADLAGRCAVRDGYGVLAVGAPAAFRASCFEAVLANLLGRCAFFGRCYLGKVNRLNDL